MVLRLCAIFLMCLAVVIVAEVFLPEESSLRVLLHPMTAEQKVLFAACETARQGLKSQGAPTRYPKVSFLVRDQRLENDPILNDLRKCFGEVRKAKGPVSPYRLEVELFSSDFGTQSSSDLQAQISAFNTQTGNKVAESGFRIDHEPYIPKSATPGPGAAAATPAAAAPTANAPSAQPQPTPVSQ